MTISSSEIGLYLSRIREKAGIKQAELARKVTWSPAVLSRIESGERELAHDELTQLLVALDSPEANKLLEVLERKWIVLPRPALDHPDQDLLWRAEVAAQQLQLLADRPDVRPAFERRLSEYMTELSSAAERLFYREHNLAFVGSIGIGKSTAICRLTGLEIDMPDSPQPVTVLEAGAGGITICEVHLRSGPGYGILIEPRSDDEIRADVTDFADYIRGSVLGVMNDSSSDDEYQGISKEVERAIRNMAGLKIRREKLSDGKTVRHDEAKELAQSQSSTRDFVVEILSRMELHRRDRRDVWHDAASGKEPLVWLKSCFEKINNGRHQDFTLPKRIEVVIPECLLELDDLAVRIVDTKGIDRTAARADLEELLDDPHTLTILCSGFNNAPGSEAQLLLKRASEAGVRSLQHRAALLVLARPDEALAVKDESGMRVENRDEGYELKGEQVSMSLQPMGLESLAVGFFNAYQDDPEILRNFLVCRIDSARNNFRLSLSGIVDSVTASISNYEKEQSQAVIRQAAGQISAWIKNNDKVGSLNAHIQDSLLQQMATAYAATVRASVVREGDWHNLNYSHHLGYGARRMAVLALERPVEGFTEVCKTMMATDDLSEAADLIAQSERVLRSSYDDLLRKVQLMGQTSFRDELKLDKEFWNLCASEWGKGSGYKDRVSSRSRNWFSREKSQALQLEMIAMIEREWRGALSRISSLIDLGG